MLPTAARIARETRAGRRSARRTLDETLARIAVRDAEVRAFRYLDIDGARARADALDAGAAGAQGALAGVPIALKANLCHAGQPTDCGSRLLADYRAPYSATCVERLIAAGAIVLGTTHMDEFAMGSSGENSAFGATRNPWDPQLVPGGSSSGSAAAVAAGMVPLALGSDTGGSVRQPAAFCGIVGFKPSYGRVSRYGLVALASSLDHVAPFGRCVDDIELLLSVLAGPDARDATCRDEPFPEPAPAGDLARLRIGIAPQLLPSSVAADVRARFGDAVEQLCGLGAQRERVELPHTPHGLATYYVIATAEASSNLARFDGVRYGTRAEGDGSLAGMMSATRRAGLGREVQRRILLGTHVLSGGYRDAWYGRAQRVRARIAADFERAFERVDLIACPTAPTTAFALGAHARDPLAMYATDALTVPPSLAGLPAINVPMLRAPGTLPAGLQLIGPRGADARVLAAARAFQRATAGDGGWPAADGGVH